MKDQYKKKKQLIEELEALRRQVVKLRREEAKRKRAEEALRESEEKFATAFRNSPDSITLIGLSDERVVEVNDGFCHATGYRREEILGHTSLELNLWSDLSERARFVSMLRDQKRVIGFEASFRIKSGEIRVGLAAGEVVQIGDQPFALITIRDITDHKRAEEALKRERDRAQRYLDIAGVMLVAINTDQEVILINRKGCEILEYKEDKIIGRNWFDHFIPERDRKSVKAVFAKLVAAEIEPVEHFENTVLTESRMEKIIAWHNTIITDEKGHIMGTLSSGEDVTERKRAEDALRESEERYRTLVETSPDAITLLDLNLNIVMTNRPALTLYGYENPEEVIGQSALGFIAPEDRPRAVEDARKMFETGSIVNPQYTLLRKDGVPFPAEVRTSLILNAEKKPLSIICVSRDITERNRAEEEKTALQEQLRQSQKIEAIGRLAGGIAHDFNNLLTVIKGYSQLSLLETEEGGPLRENIEEIKKAAEKAADLTRQLLAFSRRQILEMKVLDLNNLLVDLDKMLHRLIGEDIGLITLLADDLGRVKTDPGWVEQIIMNLAVNARDAMPNGGKLTIETANVELDEAYARGHIAVKPGRYVMLSVSDTGVGMTPEVKQQVFEPFFTTKEKGKGTGLGLSTVYGIVKQSGGNIWVYSERGQGTTFKIYLPRVDEPLEELKERLVKEEFPQGKETVLVVEDEEAVRQLAVRILKRQGYTVLDTPDGDSALVICEERKEPIHLILTDVIMPGMSGRQLVDRCSQVRQDFKVLYMSGYTDNAIVQHGVLVEGINYIQKPFTVDALARKVREVLDK